MYLNIYILINKFIQAKVFAYFSIIKKNVEYRTLFRIFCNYINTNISNFNYIS